ncbi:hypothetical protein GCU56_10025 [Geodermatophilus sabuli]|uniref:Uncharacterized protein n=1 Tax=Geodermatophilus sabuli TaxID=1564158 RepID=A0A7K3W002_9ACTN|nr:hypothetical protein [Geodermatophilus sabuli]NEK58206.1 hypothetical protein [Geodermatophilus sabuli]
MGRHSALDGAEVHPVVAEALARRSLDTSPGRHGQLRADGSESGLGWPGPVRTGERVGWPGGMPDPGERGALDGADHGEPAPQPRRGWRRFFRAA